MRPTVLRRLFFPALGATLALTLSACGTIQKDRAHYSEVVEQSSRVDRHSAFPAVRRSAFEQVNFVELIDPHGHAAKKYQMAWKAADQNDGDREWGRKYDLVLAYFREFGDADKAVAHRNSVQDRILGVATSRCNVFKTYLRRKQADTNFFLGTATTISGVLGAVLPGVNASRNLAGAAGIFSGTQAQYNSDYYSNLAAHVIVQGIEIHQNRVLEMIAKQRAGLSIEQYTLEGAIKDAIVYDGSCSTVVGLIEASEAIKETGSPGLATAARVISAVRATAAISQAPDFGALSKSGELAQLLKQTATSPSPLLVTTLSSQKTEPNLLQKISAAAQANTTIEAQVLETGDELVNAFNKAKEKWPAAANPVFSSAKLLEHYKTTVDKQLAEKLVKGLDSCVKLIPEAAGKLSIAQAKLDANSNSIDDKKNLMVAKAEAESAIAKVDRLTTQIKSYLEKYETDWVGLFAKPETNLEGLAAPSAPAPTLTCLAN
jgi:hypothetical protein